MHIRIATRHDAEHVRSLLESTFGEDEGDAVGKLAADLMAEDTVPEILSLVAESDGAIVGYIAFSPVFIEGNDEFRGSILAPLGVTTARQKGGIGRALIEDGLSRLSKMDVSVVFVYGDPGYYGRFGFSADAADGYTAPYPLQYPFGWQALVLSAPDPSDSPEAITCVESLSDPGLW